VSLKSRDAFDMSYLYMFIITALLTFVKSQFLGGGSGACSNQSISRRPVMFGIDGFREGHVLHYLFLSSDFIVFSTTGSLGIYGFSTIHTPMFWFTFWSGPVIV
jgi:hypothetical protein